MVNRGAARAAGPVRDSLVGIRRRAGAVASLRLVEFLILGPFEARRGGQRVGGPGPKLRALLAMLVLDANAPVSAERLAIALWGEDAPAAAVNTIQVYVARLRSALDEDDL